MADLHLFEFDGGYYAAPDKPTAFEVYDKMTGDLCAEFDFIRSVPDSEEIEVTCELGDHFGDDRQYSVLLPKPQRLSDGTELLVKWCLKLTARQWANDEVPNHESDDGYRFGGDY